jgi:hypothetical protein
MVGKKKDEGKVKLEPINMTNRQTNIEIKGVRIRKRGEIPHGDLNQGSMARNEQQKSEAVTLNSHFLCC